jgi:alkaline phosphatase
MRWVGVSQRVLAVLLAVFSVVLLAGASQDETGRAGTPGGEAKNVIIFVGDGMGASQRNLIRLATVGLEGELAMDNLPYEGRSHTNSADPETFVTDSAAGGTALATGVKTYNGAISVDANEQPVETVLEQAKRAGKSTGLVTDSQVTDATPASFGAHVPDREDQSEIARQYVEESQPDVILGGGEDHWYPEDAVGAYPDEPEEDSEEKSRGTEGDLVERAEAEGYEYVSDADGLGAATGPKILGLFANEEMFQQKPEGEGDSYAPVVSLAEMTRKAIETLSGDEDGFFLLVEEEAIDEMSHQNNTPLTIEAGQALDEAVEVARSYAEGDTETLLIVTADHETGGLAIESLNEQQDDPDYPNESGEGRSAEDEPFSVAGSDQEYLVDWTTANHTAEDVLVTAVGPRASELTGVFENTHIYEVMSRGIGFGQ